MRLDGLPEPLARTLERPDLRLLGDYRMRLDPGGDVPFRLAPEGDLLLDPGLAADANVAFVLRHALELALLHRIAPRDGALAGLAAARTACLFLRLERICGLTEETPEDAGWQGALSADAPPDYAAASRAAAALGRHWPAPPAPLTVAGHAALVAMWPLLGPAEWLMETGGDARLRLDPATGLNRYGCSPRPRPWAITFASSTASSVSERGYAGAEAARRRLLRAALDGTPDAGAELARARREIAAFYDLPDGAEVVLAASGTDAALFAVALAGLHPERRAVASVVALPEETGSGVPNAAAARHFAADTARGAAVAKDGLVEGFAEETRFVGVAGRDRDGALRPAADIAADCGRAVAVERAAGRRVLLHLVDVSKTGLVMPDAETAAALAAAHGDAVEVVVDACQARLAAARVRQHVAGGRMVQVTGSKFFTGPPFCGALLLPQAVAARLDGGALPRGLAAYTARPEWPARAGAAALPADGNAGLALRWHAALAEMHAFAGVPAEARRALLAGFVTRVRQAIDANPDLVPLAVPPLTRDPAEAEWDAVGTILSFAVRASAGLLDPAAAHKVYLWLNADLAPALPQLRGAARDLARRRCHIGQPVPLACPGGGRLGVLRISAGARLVSGEPSHARLDPAARAAREAGDAVTVLAKLSLIVRHIDCLRAADPQPTFG